MSIRLTVFMAVFNALAGSITADVAAFSGADGAGMYSVGGRGGIVYEVTNLNDSGEGSFRAGCAEKGPRTIVFRVSGTIKAKSRINIVNPFITVAGQTAPGDGVCIRDAELMIRTHDVIVRYMKFRRGNEREAKGDCLNVMSGAHDVIVDHCTCTWGTDENLSCYGATNVTIQWCMIGEGFYGHSCGGLWGPGNSYHHNLIYSNGTRNPKLAYGKDADVWDIRNNVIYNFGYQSCYGSASGNVNFVNNYYEYGPGTQDGQVRCRIAVGDGWNVYADGNFVYGCPEITADNWAGGIQGKYVKSDKPFEAAAVTIQPAKEARKYVLQSAGAKRDAADIRFLNEMKTRTYSFAGKKGNREYPGIPDSIEQVGGWPELKSQTAVADADRDGMCDEWEMQNGLSPENEEDRNGYTLDKDYTNLEVYINGLCPGPYDKL